MYQHLLLIYSDYSEGKRIAFHKCYDSVEKMIEFISSTDRIKETFSHLTFSFHHIQTESKDICSIESYDPYFRGLEYFSDIEEYIELIKYDTEIKPIDIAKIILSKKSYSQLELEKIMYFADCEYLKLYGIPIFFEEFEAWDYGPVIPDVYHKFKHYGREKIKFSEEEKLISCSKMMKFKEYDKVSSVIDKVIKKYENFTANDLVDETHKPNSPWDLVYKDGLGKNRKIGKCIVKDYVNRELVYS